MRTYQRLPGPGDPFWRIYQWDFILTSNICAIFTWRGVVRLVLNDHSHVVFCRVGGGLVRSHVLRIVIRTVYYYFRVVHRSGPIGSDVVLFPVLCIITILLLTDDWVQLFLLQFFTREILFPSTLFLDLSYAMEVLHTYGLSMVFLNIFVGVEFDHPKC